MPGMAHAQPSTSLCTPHQHETTAFVQEAATQTLKRLRDIMVPENEKLPETALASCPMVHCIVAHNLRFNKFQQSSQGVRSEQIATANRGAGAAPINQKADQGRSQQRESRDYSRSQQPEGRSGQMTTTGEQRSRQITTNRRQIRADRGNHNADHDRS